MEFVYLIVALALTVALMPRPKTPQQAKPTESDLDMPTVEQGRKWPVIFGTPWIEDPVVMWYGDFYVKAVKSKGGKK
jgi:hypothetical protein